MNFLGVIVNAVGVVLGGILGTLLGGRLPKKMGETLLSGMALCVISAAIAGMTAGGNLIMAITSIALGGVVGELIDFDARINRFGERVQIRFASVGSRFGEGFVSATLLFCVGAMAIVGSMESGMNGNPNTLLAKSLIDTIAVVVLASTLGIGCAFSGFSLLLYQGLLTLLAGQVAVFLSAAVIAEISFIGSILLLGVGLNVLGVTKIKIGNLVLAPFLPILLIHLF